MSISTEIQRLQSAKENIKNAIEEKGVSVGNGLLDTYPDKIDEVYDKGVIDGKQSQYDEFWGSYQDNGARGDYVYAFSGKGWDDNTYNPKYDLNITSAGVVFQNSLITNTKKSINLNIPNSGACAIFYGAQSLERIPELNLQKDIYFAYTAFRSCKNLIEINIVGEGKMGCSSTSNTQKTISFDSTKLNADSIRSIVYALKDDVTGYTLSFTPTAVNNAFEGGETSDEWKALKASKPNWTIAIG